ALARVGGQNREVELVGPPVLVRARPLTGLRGRRVDRRVLALAAVRGHGVVGDRAAGGLLLVDALRAGGFLSHLLPSEPVSFSKQSGQVPQKTTSASSITKP